MADHRHRAVLEGTEVDVSVAALERRAAPSEIVAQKRLGRHAPDEVDADIADEREGNVALLEGKPGADSDRLLPTAVVEGAGNATLAVEPLAGLLEGSREVEPVAGSSQER
jgi:hypothetical protein